jgi:predicted nucleic acid-binding protein
MVIDTNIFIEHLRAKNKSATTFYHLLFASSASSLYVSVITAFELYAGADTALKISDIDTLLSGLTILIVNEEIAKEAGSIYVKLRKTSQLIGERDILIAATAMVHQLPLKTGNQKHFQKIAGLTLL